MPYPFDDAHVGDECSPGRSRASVVPRGKRKVLMIAYTFPPSGGSGVQQSAKFAKDLPQFGWLPTVWTADEVDGLPCDPALCEELTPEVEVSPRKAGSGILAMRRSLRGFVNARAGEGLTAAASRFAKAIDWRLEEWQSATSLPDDCIPWARRSVGPLTRQLRSESFDVIYSTFSPASNHWLALELKRRMSKNLPWVADFRDLWTDDYRYRAPSPQRRAAYRQLEQEVLEAADIVIVVSERQRRILADHMPAKRDKFITITNGFDPDDFAGVGDAESKGDLRFNTPSACGSEGLAAYSRFELTRRLASVFDRLADRSTEAVETVPESLATCQP
jgi:glycosyltransferase involved in cell wall biosynthesis